MTDIKRRAMQKLASIGLGELKKMTPEKLVDDILMADPEDTHSYAGRMLAGGAIGLPAGLAAIAPINIAAHKLGLIGSAGGNRLGTLGVVGGGLAGLGLGAYSAYNADQELQDKLDAKLTIGKNPELAQKVMYELVNRR